MTSRPRRPGRSCAGLLVAAGLAAAACSKSSSSPAAAPLPSPSGTAPARFAFEAQGDATAQALTTLYRTYVAAPTSEAELRAAWALRDQARAFVAQNAEAVTTRVLAELEAPADDDGSSREILFHLLAETGTGRATGALRDVALSALPPAGTGATCGDTARSKAVHLRRAAVAELRRSAVLGSAVARDRLLDVVAGGDASTRRAAVTAFYDASPDRFRARREMAARLPPSERYVLYELTP